MQTALSRSDFATQFHAPKKIERVDLPDLRKSLDDQPFAFVRMLSAAERSQWQESMRTYMRSGDVQLNLRNAEARLCVLCLCNDKGERLFTDLEADDFANMGARPVSQIYAAASALNGLTKEDLDFFLKSSMLAQNSTSSSASLTNGTAPSAS